MDPPPPPAPHPPGPSLDAAPPPPPPAPALKAAPGKHRDAAPPDDDPSLDAELPVVLQDLVPLSYLIDRVVADAYADLANLVETLPSQNDQARKRAIVDYVLHTRRQVLKLLVLTRWSTEADRIGKAMNIVGFLSMQNHAIDASVAALTDTTTMLSGARVRNYDLSSALAVLSTGTYPALPSSLREPFESGSAPLDDAQVLDTLTEVDDVLRWRLVMGRETIPPPMTRVPWRIHDGRVTFVVPGLWEASFTYGGGAKDEDEGQEGAEWFLLGVKFLFRVRDARGSWASTPLGPLKEHLIDMCNRELLRRPYFPPPEPPFGAAPSPPAPAPADAAAPAPAADGEGEAEAGAGADPIESDKVKEARRKDERDEIVRRRRRDRPLDRAYTFLQRLALSYQLEAVYSTAVRLAATSWSGNLKVEMSKERDEVRVEYWSYKPELPAAQAGRAPPAQAARSGPGGALIFSIRPPASPSDAPAASAPAVAAPASRIGAREHALQAALSSASSSSASLADPPAADVADAAPPSPDVPLALSVSWQPPSSASPPPPAAHSRLASLPLRLSASLDLEALLRRVTAIHARETVERLAEVVRGAPGEKERGARVVYPPAEGVGAERLDREDGMELDDEDAEEDEGEEGEADEESEQVPHLLLPLVGSQALSAHINPLSGRFELRLASTAASANSAEGDAASAVVEQRLRAAAERIDFERFVPAPPPPGVGGAVAAVDGEVWMRGVAEVVARLRASTILDDLDTLLSLLSLPFSSPAVRRLPLPARELAKFGPPFPTPGAAGRTSLLFVPLSLAPAATPAPSGLGTESWFVVFVLFDDGFRAALVRMTEASDGMNSFLEVGEVGWLGAGAGGEAEGKGKERETGGEGATNLGFEVKGETVRALWAYCVHRVALFKLEQQLHLRHITFALTQPSSSRTATLVDEGVLPRPPARPYLLVASTDLVRLSESAKVLAKDAVLQCSLSDEGQLRTTLSVRFRLPASHQSVFTSLPDPSELPEGVLWNPKRGVMVFVVDEGPEHALERFLRAFATAVRTVLAALHAAAASAAAASAEPSAHASPNKKGRPHPSAQVLPNGVAS
ncbi:mediator of RNA polymerase II transcription subunit 14 [Rhodotorula paludigena]|uniref:mediator of RNA polymerase II transcription subunit 14 n=1 Tax=Rhodotorula paludigena TaxID=86838 RepID=UPI003181B5E9